MPINLLLKRPARPAAKAARPADAVKPLPVTAVNLQPSAKGSTPATGTVLVAASGGVARKVRPPVRIVFVRFKTGTENLHLYASVVRMRVTPFEWDLALSTTCVQLFHGLLPTKHEYRLRPGRWPPGGVKNQPLAKRLRLVGLDCNARLSHRHGCRLHFARLGRR